MNIGRASKHSGLMQPKLGIITLCQDFLLRPRMWKWRPSVSRPKHKELFLWIHESFLSALDWLGRYAAMKIPITWASEKQARWTVTQANILSTEMSPYQWSKSHNLTMRTLRQQTMSNRNSVNGKDSDRRPIAWRRSSMMYHHNIRLHKEVYKRGYSIRALYADISAGQRDANSIN